MTAAFLPYQELTSLCSRFVIDRQGQSADHIPWLHLHHCSAPTAPLHSPMTPTLAFIIQGAKSLTLGQNTYRYGAGQYLLTSLDLPVSSWVMEASGGIPYLCACIDIRLDRLHDLLGRLDLLKVPPADEDLLGLSVNHASPELIDALTRLVRLLEQPGDIAAMAPIIEQEILYRLLMGPEGPKLIHMAMAESQSHRVARAVDWLRSNFHRPLKVEELCERVGMSQSSFHHHFKAVTALTPVQYQKRLRLHEARRLMLVEGLDAGNAGHRVGYQSPSQFSREYGRLYGLSPARDMESVRENAREAGRAGILPGAVAAE